ncbi:MAG: 23S rRNA (pseudouridine(1915)-N(3))-methyltransferase RlmH [Lachnospiraceae bacterium]|nr:23S rRNA (pseudouridine(1915)-N(3))-methyltransferase RlmH [Lachnospiraceae bacterium]
MKCTIICAGRLKESYFADAVNEYAKRLSRYCTLKIEEVNDGPDPASEAARIIKKIPGDAYIITCEIKGERYSSEEFAGKLESIMVNGNNHIVFIIGGSDGLDESVISTAHLHLSFSDLTFPHMLMRVILVEQIYRAFRILNNEPYHK